MKIRTTLLAKTSALIAAAALSATVCALLTGTATAAEKVPRGAPIQPLAPKKGEPIKPLTIAEPVEAASAKKVAAEAVAPKVAETDGEFAVVGFDKLSTFKYEVPDDVVTNAPAAVLKDPDQQIPAAVKAYNGKRVSLKGFMLPLDTPPRTCLMSQPLSWRKGCSMTGWITSAMQSFRRTCCQPE